MPLAGPLCDRIPCVGGKNRLKLAAETGGNHAMANRLRLPSEDGAHQALAPFHRAAPNAVMRRGRSGSGIAGPSIDTSPPAPGASRKHAGAYYTPDSVAASLVHWALRSDADR